MTKSQTLGGAAAPPAPMSRTPMIVVGVVGGCRWAVTIKDFLLPYIQIKSFHQDGWTGQ